MHPSFPSLGANGVHNGLLDLGLGVQRAQVLYLTLFLLYVKDAHDDHRYQAGDCYTQGYD